MILDSELILSGTVSSGTWTGQRICNAGATEYSTDYVDQLAKGQAIKSGARIKVISTGVCAGTGTTLTISLECDDNASFTSAKTLLSTGAIAKADTATGTVLMDMIIPPGAERYLRLNYTGNNTFETTGAAVAYIVLDSDRTIDKAM